MMLLLAAVAVAVIWEEKQRGKEGTEGEGRRQA